MYAAAGSLLILIPITLLGFTVLARGISRQLSLNFIISNLILLLAIRDAQYIAILILAMTMANSLFNSKFSKISIFSHTREGITALLQLFY